MTDVRTQTPAATTASASLRLAVVGPTHPLTGLVAAHTTMLAHHLSDSGHDVVLLSWTNRHPSVRPRAATAPDAVPDVPPYSRTVRALRWSRPDSWVRTGRRLRSADAVIVVTDDPSAVPGHLTLLRSAGAVRGEAGPRPRSIVVCPSVLPVEGRAGDRTLTEWLLARVDSVLVHTAEEARVALDLGAHRVSVAELPPHLPGGEPVDREPGTSTTRLLVLGRLGEHTGVDVLLRAMRTVPDVSLTIAGELWRGGREAIDALADDPALAGRVEVREGHVPADDLAGLLAAHDAVVSPYLGPAPSQDAVLAHAHGLPVLASDVAPFSHQIEDGVNGLLVAPGDERSLAGALRRLRDPGVRARLAEGVRTPDLSGPWAHYLGTIEALCDPDLALPGPSVDAGAVPAEGTDRPDDLLDTGLRMAGSVRRLPEAVRRRLAAARARRRPLVDLRPEDLPEWVLPTDVLAEPVEAEDCRHLARDLGLPFALDGVAAWAALGTLAAVIRVLDDGRRTSVVVDETGPRSLLSRWARAVGFAPVEIDFTGAEPSVAALDVDTGSLDAIVRIHPGGCDAEDIDHVLEQASWALRSGGILVVTLPLGPPSADGALGPADVRAVLARAHGLGFVLVGDIDGDVNARMRAAGARARAGESAYGLVRLTLRRR